MNNQTRRKRETRTTHDESGFSFSNTAAFADKDELIEKNLTFTIKSIELQEDRGYEEGTDRWAVTIALDGRPDEIITFGCNDQRDAQLKSAQDFLARRGSIPNIRLRKSGRAYYFENVVPA